jgi:hypothetical protein
VLKRKFRSKTKEVTADLLSRKLHINAGAHKTLLGDEIKGDDMGI